MHKAAKLSGVYACGQGITGSVAMKGQHTMAYLGQMLKAPPITVQRKVVGYDTFAIAMFQDGKIAVSLNLRPCAVLFLKRDDTNKPERVRILKR